MTAIQIKQNGPQHIAKPQAAQPYDASRLLARMMAWDPFREMTPFLHEPIAAFEPAFEVKETKDGYLFKADVPGIQKGDLDVSLIGNRLTVTGKRESEKMDKGDTYYAYERSYGSFTRSFTLPEGVDAAGIHADLRDGVLSLSLPKKPESQPKAIPITTPAETKKA